MSDVGSAEKESAIYSIVPITVKLNALTVKDDPLPAMKQQYVVEKKYTNMSECLQKFLLLCTVLLFFIVITTAIAVGIIFGTPSGIFKTCLF